MSVIAGWEKKVLSTYNIIINIKYVRKIFLIRESLRVRSIGKSDLVFQNLNPDFSIKREIENGIHLREIRLQGGFQLRNPNPDFMDFLFTVRLGNPKKDLQNYSREQWSSFC